MNPAKAKRRGFIQFQAKGNRPSLTRDQFEYWLEILAKVLKVGTEFEINLPDGGALNQNKEEQPCVHSEKPCVRDCANLETCLVERHPSLCATRSTGQFLGQEFTCPASSNKDVAACKSCPAWALDCRGLNCSMHTPYCSVCPSFLRKGEVVEKGDIRRDAESVRREMKDHFQPSGFVGKLGRYGVLEVKKDNSLQANGGIEVPTVGRRVHWNSFYQMCRDIIAPIAERGGFVNERCGQHFHVLAGYFQSSKIGQAISELEEPMPEIILANFHQLTRRYELAMFWIMSCGNQMEHLTRWAKFRQSVFKYGSMNSSMAKVQGQLAENIVSMNNNQKGKYASVAYHFCEFNTEGNVSTFHIENRIADGALSPIVVTAWAMLCYVMVLKAVRLSQYGVMEVGDSEYVGRVKEIQPLFIDGELRDWNSERKADTSKLGPHISWLRENARELINFLKPELHGLGPAYDVLMALADRPCSLRLVQGDTWEGIERSLSEEAGAKKPYGPEDEVREVVDLAGIVDCETVTVWVEEVSASLGRPTAEVEEIVSQMVQSGRYRWSQPIGALITS